MEWLFALEWLNGNIKDIKISGRNMAQKQVVALRALLRQRFALQRLKKAAQSKVDPPDTSVFFFEMRIPIAR